MGLRAGIGVLSENSSTPLQRRMNLREALKIEAENAPRVHKTGFFLSRDDDTASQASRGADDSTAAAVDST